MNIPSAPVCKFRRNGSAFFVIYNLDCIVVLSRVPSIMLEKLKKMATMTIAEKAPPVKVLYLLSSLYLKI